MRRLAHRRSARRDEGVFVIEGPTLVTEALDAGLAFEAAFFERSGAWSAVDDTVRRLDDASVPTFEVVPGGLARVADAVTPQGIVAVAAPPPAAREVIDAADVVLVLVGVADPGNAGALIRTAEATGAGVVVVTGGSVDPFSPKCVRSSAGSVFRVPTVVAEDAVAVLARAAEGGRRRIGTVARDGAPYHAVDLTPPLALVLGNEAHGLPDDLRPHIDEWVHIPMSGRVESLNVAITGALLLFEAARQQPNSIGRQRPDTAGLAPND